MTTLRSLAGCHVVLICSKKKKDRDSDHDFLDLFQEFSLYASSRPKYVSQFTQSRIFDLLGPIQEEIEFLFHFVHVFIEIFGTSRNIHRLHTPIESLVPTQLLPGLRKSILSGHTRIWQLVDHTRGLLPLLILLAQSAAIAMLSDTLLGQAGPQSVGFFVVLKPGLDTFDLPNSSEDRHV